MSDEEDPNLIGVSNTRDGSKALGSYREMWNLIEKVVEERKCKSSNVTIETTEVRQLQRIVQVTTFKFFFFTTVYKFGCSVVVKCDTAEYSPVHKKKYTEFYY